MLFGTPLEISNETHQGLINVNEIALGCHYLEKDGTLFPLTLRGDLHYVQQEFNVRRKAMA